MRITQILWLTVGPTACGSYRCYVPALTLSATGRYRSRLVNIAASPGPTPRQLDLLRASDVVVLQRSVTPAGEAWADACDRLGVRLVYEIDDDLPNLPPHHPFFDKLGAAPARRRLARFVGQAVHVIASTPPLAHSLRRTFELVPERVSIAPNHLHPFVWGHATDAPSATPVARDATVTIGWQGTPTHDGDFVDLVPALRRLVAVDSRVRIGVLGDVPTPLANQIPVDRVVVQPAVVFQQYPAALRAARFDIGLAPLVDTAFNAAKSNIKWLEYSACGIPTVASPVEPYASSIADRATGMLATSADEWFIALLELVRDPDRRRTIGLGAHADAWTRWSAAARGPAWTEIFDRIC
jgi:glycosyltransferase involved in cell wall biosynthesis